jgi:NTP pyrophosphatase (non-canonical NTP hydrolase)
MIVIPEDMSLNDFKILAGNIAIKHGCDESKRAVGSCLMGITSELGEAYSALRKDNRVDHTDLLYIIKVLEDNTISDDDKKLSFETIIKDKFEDEIADTFIRLLNLCNAYHIDIAKQIKAKMYYNDIRTWKTDVDQNKEEFPDLNPDTTI